MADNKNKYFEGVGRRKSAVARVRLFPEGKGDFVVNEQDYKEYFNIERYRQSAVEPLKILAPADKKKVSVSVKVSGGGPMGQAEAVTLGLARALVKYDKEHKERLRTEGFLTRDPRRVERKKYGLKKARRAPQWRKR